jgi:hypothetical protein
VLNRRLAVIAAAVLLTAGASTSSARSSDSVIRATPKYQRLGEYRVNEHPTYQGAIDALGPASSCRTLGYPSVALAVWNELGVAIKLATFGGLPPGKTGCTAPDRINVWTIRVTGQGWVTGRGVRVGSPVALLKQRYLRAKRTRGVREWYGSGYWLVTRRQACIGSCKDAFVEAPVLVAETAAGRVRTLVLVIGAQGD